MDAEELGSLSGQQPHPTETRTRPRHEQVAIEDVEQQVELEKKDSGAGQSPISTPSEPDDEGDEGQRTVISFRENDPDNPHNWPSRKKSYIVFIGVIMVMNSTIGSSIASGATQEISTYFHNYNQEQLVLPVSIYLVGYVLGPLAFGPLSEAYGRKWVMVGTFIVHTAFTLGTALAPTFAALIVFRFLVGIGASSPISVVGGIYADVYDNAVTRGRALTIFMTATTWGPILGPVASGFISPISWRWSFWLSLILAGITWPALLLCPESYGPVILQKRAKRMRKETGNREIYAPIELEQRDMKQLVTVVLTRPIRMICFEAIVLCSCLYLSFAYAIFYMFFQAFPIVFTGVYGFNAGEEGLTFLPIGVGAVFACGLYLWWDAFLEKAKNRNPPAKWTKKEEFRRLPLACLGGPLFVISLFWLGWTARKDIHWIVPTLAALPFGMGFLLLFMALLNYLVDAYEEFAASATAAAACSRSLFGVLLPFAAKPMYNCLGIAWACSLLGFLSLAMCAIPFVFIKYGDRIREKSKFCQELKKKKEQETARREREWGKDRRESGQVLEQQPEKMV